MLAGARRAAELGETVDRFVADGVPTRQIVVAGQSYGGSAALMFAAHNPDKLNSVIAFVPGHGLAKYGRVWVWYCKRKLLK